MVDVAQVGRVLDGEAVTGPQLIEGRPVDAERLGPESFGHHTIAALNRDAVGPAEEADVAAHADHHPDHGGTPGGKVEAAADEHDDTDRHDGAGCPQGEEHQVHEPASRGVDDRLRQLRPDKVQRQQPEHDRDKTERGRHQRRLATADGPQAPFDARPHRAAGPADGALKMGPGEGPARRAAAGAARQWPPRPRPETEARARKAPLRYNPAAPVDLAATEYGSDWPSGGVSLPLGGG